MLRDAFNPSVEELNIFLVKQVIFGGPLEDLADNYLHVFSFLRRDFHNESGVIWKRWSAAVLCVATNVKYSCEEQ